MIRIDTFEISDPLISTFEEFRKQQESRNDKLSHNYSCSNFNFLEQEAFSIGYKNNNPFLFSTIFRRQQWPTGAYRILNRTWKVDRQSHVSTGIDQIFLDMVSRQISWLRENKKVMLQRDEIERFRHKWESQNKSKDYLLQDRLLRDVLEFQQAQKENPETALSNEDKKLKTLFLDKNFLSYEKGAHSILPQKNESLSGERSASL